MLRQLFLSSTQPKFC